MLYIKFGKFGHQKFPDKNRGELRGDLIWSAHIFQGKGPPIHLGCYIQLSCLFLVLFMDVYCLVYVPLQ